jgi:hypothetical protein
MEKITTATRRGFLRAAAAGLGAAAATTVGAASQEATNIQVAKIGSGGVHSLQTPLGEMLGKNAEKLMKKADPAMLTVKKKDLVEALHTGQYHKHPALKSFSSSDHKVLRNVFDDILKHGSKSKHASLLPSPMSAFGSDANAWSVSACCCPCCCAAAEMKPKRAID